MARLRNFVRKIFLRGFRAVLFLMVPKLTQMLTKKEVCFRAVLFLMVPKQEIENIQPLRGFRAVLFLMVPKPL